MESKKQNWFSDILKNIFSSHYRENFILPWDWSIQNIDFSNYKSAENLKFIPEKSMFLKDPINYWNFKDKKRELTLVAPEQTGKTLAWIMPYLWSFVYVQALSLVIYTSDEKAEKVNADKIIPLMQRIKRFTDALLRPKSKTKDCYDILGNKSYFSGAGTPVTSISSQINIADEVDDWLKHQNQVSNLDELRKRARSFTQSLLVKVCTPRGDADGSIIWQEFLKSSMGYWHLGCFNCNGLTMRSADIINLQFDVDDLNNPIKDSCRLICPKCKREHSEYESKIMNINGGYIHECPDRFDYHAGFQWGALAAVGVPDLSWNKIAAAQLNAGKSADYNDQLLFDNSFRGLPWQKRKSNDSNIKILEGHIAPLPEPKQVKYSIMACDTQDDSIYYVVRGFDLDKNNWLLACGQARTWEQLEEVWQREYYGKQPVMGIIDSGGHRMEDCKEFVKDKRGFYLYKGDSKIGCRQKISEENERLILAKPLPYQCELLYSIYFSQQKTKGLFYLNDTINQEYKDQLTSVQPDKKVRNGHALENWYSPNGEDHLFDCEKEILVANEFYLNRKNKSTTIKATNYQRS